MIEKNIDKYRIFIFENKFKLTSYLTEYISNKIKTSLKVNDRFTFCVCGGSTPKGIDYDRKILIINTLRINGIHIINNGKQIIGLAGSTLFDLEKKLDNSS